MTPILPNVRAYSKSDHVETHDVNTNVFTSRTLINPNATPKELWNRQQFVCWRYEDRGRPKLEKVPVNPRTLGRGGTTWANTWTDIRTAVATYRANPTLNGVGFVLTASDPYTMIDLDSCVVNRNLSPFASDLIDELGTYAELSPSGRGVRLFVRTIKPATLKKPEIEVYFTERFCTLTGDVLTNHPIAEFDDLDWLIERFRPIEGASVVRKEVHAFSVLVEMTPQDRHVWDRMLSSRKAVEIQKLFSNPTSSENDWRFLLRLRYWCNADPDQMLRLALHSPLNRDKWHQKRGQTSFIQYEIQRVLNA